MSRQRFHMPFVWLTVATGGAVALFCLIHLPVARLDLRFSLLALVTILVGSRVSIKIPRVSGEVTVADTLIFLAMLLYGAEAACLLAAVEALCSSLHVSRKVRVLLFNSAVLTCSTFVTSSALRLCFGPPLDLTRGEFSAGLIAAACLMATVQYAANSGLVAVYTSCKINEPLWQTWRKYYLWTSITYFVGATAAVLIGKLVHEFGFHAVIAMTPIVAVLYVTYRTYLKNIEVSIAQAEQAERHIEELNRYIREHQQAEEALRVSESEMRALFAAMSDVVIVLDAEGRYLKIAPTNPSYLYRPPAELVGKKLHEVFEKEMADFFLTHVRRALSEGRTQRVTYRLLLAGAEVWFDGSVSPLSHDSALWIARDTTERKHAEEALRGSEERYRLLFELNPQPMWVYDQETLTFLAVNEAAVKHYGYSREEFLAMTINDIRPPEEVPTFLEFLAEPAAGPAEAGTWKHRKKDGSTLDVEITSHRLTFSGRPSELVLVNDITERKQIEEQLRQSQKMEAVGKLAGGVAHDFNNLLTAITGYSELSLRRLSLEEPLHRNISEIKKAGERAAGLTRQLLAFSRKQVLQPKVLDLNQVVLETNRLLQRLIGEDIELLTKAKADLGKVKADPGQIEQVLMNLAVNARDAMPNGGALVIETANVYLDENYASRHPSVEPGWYVMLAVSDTGCGMDAETRERIFEPFFTTKEVGKGTGLGLSTVYGIVKQSGGNIWVYSEVGLGTAFKIYLPRADKPEENEASDEMTSSDTEILKGTETVLLVEDEEMVRVMTREILLESGYHILEARNGNEALSVSERYQGPIHLLLTDVVMPQMGGRELAERLSKCRPEMRVLYMSGYTDDAIVRHGVLEEAMAFIQKPFAPDALGRKVREMLEAPQGVTA
jgi:two-component system cell cycle sensor histidine kinase/response regulator CckA